MRYVIGIVSLFMSLTSAFASEGGTLVFKNQGFASDTFNASLLSSTDTSYRVNYFQSTAFSSLLFKQSVGGAKVDWSNRDAIGFTVVNSSGVAQTLCINIVSQKKVSGVDRVTNLKGCRAIAPGTADQQLGFPLYFYQSLSGLPYRPSVPSIANENVTPMITQKKNLDRDSIVSVQFSLKMPSKNSEITIKQLRFLRFIDTTNLVDSYGRRNDSQYFPRTYLNTVYPLNTPENIREAQLKLLNNPQTTASDLDSYGGCISCGTYPNDSGHFKVQKVNNRWWFVTPAGHLFFSLGVNAVDYDSVSTLVYDETQDRRSLFAELPSSGYVAHYNKNVIAQGRQLREISSYSVITLPDGSFTDNFGVKVIKRTDTSGVVHYYVNDVGVLPRSTPKGDVQMNWQQRAVDRLLSWGFNSLGNFSRPDLFAAYQNYYSAPLPKMPYTTTSPSLRLFPRAPADGSTPATLPFLGTSLEVPVFWLTKDGFSTPLPDVFSDAFYQYTHNYTVNVNGVITTGFFYNDLIKKANLDPYCIGIFVDNETHWDGGASEEKFFLAQSIMKDANGLDVKDRMLTYLTYTGGYKTIKALRDTWCKDEAGKTLSATSCYIPGSDTDGLSTLLKKTMILPELPTGRLRADLENILGLYASKYYDNVKTGLKKFAENKLYLGDRFIKGKAPKVVIEKAAEKVDVMSFNLYRTYDQLIGMDWPSIMKKRDGSRINIPILASEFNFGAKDRGALRGSGAAEVATQQDRATQYQLYLKGLNKVLTKDNSDSQFVGAHWYKWIDEPVTGRKNDYENYNCGLVDVLDLPYPELVNAARAANQSIYTTLGVK